MPFDNVLSVVSHSRLYQTQHVLHKYYSFTHIHLLLLPSALMYRCVHAICPSHGNARTTVNSHTVDGTVQHLVENSILVTRTPGSHSKDLTPEYTLKILCRSFEVWIISFIPHCFSSPCCVDLYPVYIMVDMCERIIFVQ